MNPSIQATINTGPAATKLPLIALVGLAVQRQIDEIADKSCNENPDGNGRNAERESNGDARDGPRQRRIDNSKNQRPSPFTAKGYSPLLDTAMLLYGTYLPPNARWRSTSYNRMDAADATLSEDTKPCIGILTMASQTFA